MKGNAIESSNRDSLLESLASKSGQDECRLVDLFAVVSAQLFLLLGGPRSQGLLEVAIGVLAAHHEANLAGGVGRNGGVSVLDVGENLFAGLLQVGNERKVKPLVLR